MVLTENRDTQLHTIYHPNSFVPLLRAEHARMEDSHRSLAEKLEEENGSALPTELHLRLNEIEKDIRKNHLSDDNQQWLDAVGLKAENLALWLDPLPQGDALKLHLYHCDHLGTPIALISHKTSKVEWSAVMDVWGNAVDIFNPYKLRQPIRMQGQHYDEESGLHYNRHRYYDPMQGRYITQDPIGLRGGWNLYAYALEPTSGIDPEGLSDLKFKSSGEAGLHAMDKINSKSVRENKEYGGFVCKKDNEYFYTKAITNNDHDGINFSGVSCPQGADKVGTYHTHGNYSDAEGNKTSKENDAYDSLHYSPRDITGASIDSEGRKEFVCYLATPDGSRWEYNTKKSGNGVSKIK